jgi:hypothetical protein
MNDQLKDKYFKEMLQRHFEEFFNLLCPEQKYEIVSTKLDKELIVRRRETDFVAKVRVGKRVYLFHIEFISQYRRHLMRTAYGYSGALTLKYNCDVVTVLFVLKPPSKKAQSLGYYEIAPFGKPMNVHSLAVVKLWKLRDAILAGEKEYLALVPLLPEISFAIDKKLLLRQRELLASVRDPALQAELKFYTMAFLQPYFSLKFLSTHFSEEPKMLEHWERVPIFGERIKQRVREGREEGREEGMAFALQENILDVLNLRFGVTNGNIARAVHAIDEPKRLRAIFQQIIKAESLDAVKKTLAVQKRPEKKKARSGAKG